VDGKQGSQELSPRCRSGLVGTLLANQAEVFPSSLRPTKPEGVAALQFPEPNQESVERKQGIVL